MKTFSIKLPEFVFAIGLVCFEVKLNYSKALLSHFIDNLIFASKTYGLFSDFLVLQFFFYDLIF